MLASVSQEIINQVRSILNLIPIVNNRRQWHLHKDKILTILKLGRKTSKDLNIGYATFYEAVGLPSQFDYTWRQDPAITKALKTWEEEQQKKPLTSPLIIPPLAMRLNDDEDDLPYIKLNFLLPKQPQTMQDRNIPGLFSSSSRIGILDSSGIPSHNTSRPFAGRTAKSIIDQSAVANKINEILAIKEIPHKPIPECTEQHLSKVEQMTQPKLDRWIEIDDKGNMMICKNKKVQLSEEGYTVDENTTVKVSKPIPRGSELYILLLRRFSQMLPDDI